ncbi:MAG: hypothetical protein FWC73_11075 [Defluviitaleaceae bacterium]|nr:hypothetical protein [Defluviitaleaceae bacterium]
MKKRKLLYFLVFAVLITVVALLINHFREPEGYTMRELGQEAVAIIDDFLDGDLSLDDTRAIIASMIEAIDYHVENRRDPLSIREADIRLVISRLQLDLTFPNEVTVRASRNRLAGLVGVGERAS